jgi:rubrerythrin
MMRFGDYIVKDVEGVVDDGQSPLQMAVRPSTKDSKLIRESIMEEMQAINDYIERAENCENDVVRKIFLDIAEEERIHFGEFEMLLEAVDPLHEPAEEEGEEEMEEMLNPNEIEED